MSEQSDLLAGQPSESGGTLVILPLAELPTILQADDKDILKGLLRELEGWEPDASTPKGREVIRGKGQKIRVAKADFGRLADKLKEDALKTQKSVNAEFKILEQRMNELLERVRGPLTEYEGREKRRVGIHESRIKTLEEYSADYATSSEIAKDIDVYTALYAEEDFEEFAARAHKARTNTLNALRVAYQVAKTREDEATAQAQREAEEAERRRMEAAEAQRVREEQIARDATEAARVAAEADAERKAREAEEKAEAAMRAQEDAARLEREAARRREVEAQEALARAESERLAGIERERVAAEWREEERCEAHGAMLADMDERTYVSPGSSSAVIQETTRAFLAWSGHNRDWEEFADQYRQDYDGAVKHLNSCLELALKREADAEIERQRAVADRERLVAEETERQRILAEEKAVADKQAAIEAERARVAKAEAAQRAEDEKRAANVAHRGKINSAALAGIMAVLNDNWKPEDELSPEVLARKIVEAIAKGQIEHMRIEY